MVIILMFLGAIAFFACRMFIKNNSLSKTLSIIMAIVFAGSTLLMTLNYSHHFGMHKVTTTTTKQIYSASNSSLPLALYQPVGTSGRDDVYIYNVKKVQKKPNHTQANEYTTSKIKWTNTGKVQLRTTETRWRFKNNGYKILYMWSGMDGTLVKRINVLEYPKQYVKITTSQAKKLTKIQKTTNGGQKQAQVKQQGAAYVTSRVQAATAKNPHMTPEQIQSVSNKAQQEFQGKIVRQMIKQMK